MLLNSIFLSLIKCFYRNDLYPQYDNYTSPNDCQSLCQSEPECNVFTYKLSYKICYLKTKISTKAYNSDAVSGPKTCPGNLFLTHYQALDSYAFYIVKYTLKAGMSNWRPLCLFCVVRIGIFIFIVQQFNDLDYFSI